MTNDSALFAFQQLDIYRVARELAIAVREADIRHPELRDQASRASISAFLTLSEGLPNDGPGMRRKYGPQTAAAIEAFRKRCTEMITPERYYEGVGAHDGVLECTRGPGAAARRRADGSARPVACRARARQGTLSPSVSGSRQ